MARAKMAIQNGVDLVSDAPVLYATQFYWFGSRGAPKHGPHRNRHGFGLETVNPLLKTAAF